MPVKTQKSDLQAALNAYSLTNSHSEAARKLKIPRATLRDRIEAAQRAGLKATVKPADSAEQVRLLERELKAAREESADAAAIKRIFGDTVRQASALRPPSWLGADSSKPSSPGVPTLFLSDFHWGEDVRPGQINGVNRYNLSIAHERLIDCINSAIRLLSILSPRLDYPGLVMPLGGDMVSGDIHEELAESNELQTIPTVLDLLGALIAAITKAADTFGAVFLPCVGGNHGRNTKKIRAKDRNHTSFDWMLYQLLARHFANDARVTFHIPDSADAYYRIYNTRYVLTHGDQFRGGDGMIGALGPIIRGDHKKRSRNGQIDRTYDVMLLGHWHQYMHLERLIVNGSLKGYDEYAYANNFGFEPPQQALWVTHPKYGLTFRMPVKVDRELRAPKAPWVSVPAIA